MRTTMLSLPLVLICAVAQGAFADPAFQLRAGDQSRDHLLTRDGVASGLARLTGIGAASDGASDMQAWFAGVAAGLEF